MVVRETKTSRRRSLSSRSSAQPAASRQIAAREPRWGNRGRRPRRAQSAPHPWPKEPCLTLRQGSRRRPGPPPGTPWKTASPMTMATRSRGAGSSPLTAGCRSTRRVPPLTEPRTPPATTRTATNAHAPGTQWPSRSGRRICTRVPRGRGAFAARAGRPAANAGTSLTTYTTHTPAGRRAASAACPARTRGCVSGTSRVFAVLSCLPCVCTDDRTLSVCVLCACPCGPGGAKERKSQCVRCCVSPHTAYITT